LERESEVEGGAEGHDRLLDRRVLLLGEAKGLAEQQERANPIANRVREDTACVSFPVLARRGSEMQDSVVGAGLGLRVWCLARG